MKVVMTIKNGFPANHRELVHRTLIRRAPRPPAGQNLKFLELFAPAPLASRHPNALAIIKERFNQLTN